MSKYIIKSMYRTDRVIIEVIINAYNLRCSYDHGWNIRNTVKYFFWYNNI